MTTHSQLVDEMIFETKRPDLRSEISTYVNQTVRELHSAPDSGLAIRFRDNMRELSLVASVESGQSWDIPNYDRFQQLWAVRFDSVFDRDSKPRYVNERLPGRSLNQQNEFWYRAGSYITFGGYGGINAVIALAYYEYPRRLKYYKLTDRPASWDDESGWTYAAGVDTAEEILEAQAKVTNWILLRHSDLVREGTRAKVYKRVSDDTRARMSFSLYMQLRTGFWTAEMASGEGIY